MGWALGVSADERAARTRPPLRAEDADLLLDALGRSRGSRLADQLAVLDAGEAGPPA